MTKSLCDIRSLTPLLDLPVSVVLVTSGTGASTMGSSWTTTLGGSSVATNAFSPSALIDGSSAVTSVSSPFASIADSISLSSIVVYSASWSVWSLVPTSWTAWFWRGSCTCCELFPFELANVSVSGVKISPTSSVRCLKGNTSYLKLTSLPIKKFLELRSYSLYPFWVFEYPIKIVLLALGKNLSFLGSVHAYNNHPNTFRWS